MCLSAGILLNIAFVHEVAFGLIKRIEGVGSSLNSLNIMRKVANMCLSAGILLNIAFVHEVAFGLIKHVEGVG